MEHLNNSLETEVSSLERIGLATASPFPLVPVSAPAYVPPNRQNGFTSIPFQASPVKTSSSVQQNAVNTQFQQTAPSRKASAAGGARRSQEWPDIPEIGKIEEKDPNILAQKILETGRQIEAVKYGTELTPRGSSSERRPQGAEKARSSTSRSTKTSASKPNKQNPAHPQETIASPVPQASTSQSSFSMPSPSPSPLSVKPFGVQHADSTPRVNDFEDRLKNLITTVLNDNPKNAAEVPHELMRSTSPQKYSLPRGVESEREGLFARAPLKSTFTIQHAHIHQQLPDYTQYSPAKLALRRHLSQEKLSSPAPQLSKSVDPVHVRHIKDEVSLDSERSLDSYSSGLIQHGSGMYRVMSPVSRPGSTDFHPSIPSACSTSEAHATPGPFSTIDPPHVEGLAASLCGRVRNSTDEPVEPSSSPVVAIKVNESQTNEDDAPSLKKKKISHEASLEKSDPGESQSRKWQDKINSRFDKLMNFASNEMDKRRRSTESSSPRTEPFSSPRGKEPSVPALPEERSSEKKTEGKDSKRKDKEKESKSSKDSKDSKESKDGKSDRKRDRSVDEDRSKSSKSSREKDKEKDKEHRKHSSKHDKKRSETSDETKSKDIEKEREKSKEKSKSKDREKDKKESNEKRSEDRGDKHSHRDREKDKDRDKEKRREKEKHRDKSSKSSRDSSRTRTEDYRKDDHGHRSSKPLKEEESGKSHESRAQENPADSPAAQAPALQAIGNVKAEVESEERVHEHSNDGHHHFKKRFVQCQMEWDHAKPDSCKEDKLRHVKHDPSQTALSNHIAHESRINEVFPARLPDEKVREGTSKAAPPVNEESGPYPKCSVTESSQRQQSVERGSSPRGRASTAYSALAAMNQSPASGSGKPGELPPAAASVLNLYQSSSYGSVPPTDISSQRFAQYQQQTHYNQPADYLTGIRNHNMFAV